MQLDISKQGAAQIVDDMASRGLVERRLAREHGRDAVVALRGMLAAIAGEGNTEDPRLRALYV